MEKKIRIPGKRQMIFTSVAGVVVISLAFLIYSYQASTSCEGIFQQTKLNLTSSIEVLQMKGEIGFAHDKIQDLTEKAQLVALNFKACCVAAKNDLIAEGRFLECKNSTGAYETQLALAARHVTNARDAADSGNTSQAKQSSAKATTELRKSETTLENLRQGPLQMGEPLASAPRKAESGLIPQRKHVSGREREPNEGYDDANQIAVGDSLSGQVAKSSQDWYALPVDPQREYLHVKIRTTGGGSLCYARFFSAEEVDLVNFFTDDPFPSVDTARIWKVPLKGTRAVFVKLYSSSDTGCRYDLFTAYSAADL